MPDITLTITLDEDDAREFCDGHVYAANCLNVVAGAIAAALPPEPPKEGEVWGWREGESVAAYELGPIKWGMALVRRTGNQSASAVSAEYIAKHWTKVR